MMYRILALLLTLLVSGCGMGTQNASGKAGGTPGVSSQEVIFGSQTDLSSSRAAQGTASIDGARMRIKEANQAGGVHGRKIRLIVDDTGLKVPNAVSAVKKLIDQDRVFAVFLSLGIQTDNAALAEEAHSHVPDLFPLSGSRSMVEPQSDLKFTARPTYGDEVRAGIRYFTRHESKHSPCVVYDDTGYGREVLDAVRGELARIGDKLAMTTTLHGGKSRFNDVVNKVRDASCDVVFLGMGRQDSMDLLEAASEVKDDIAPFVGTDVNYGESYANLHNDAAEGLYAVTPMARLYKSDELPPKVRLWWNSYFQEYGDEPRLDAMEGYRDADLLVKALEAAGPDPTRKSLIKAIESIKDYTGPFGYHLSFGPDKHKGTSTSVLSMFTHGKWKVVDKSIQAEG